MNGRDGQRRRWRSWIIRFGVPAIALVTIGIYAYPHLLREHLQCDIVTGRERVNRTVLGIQIGRPEEVETMLSEWMDSNSNERTWVNVCPESRYPYFCYPPPTGHPILFEIRMILGQIGYRLDLPEGVREADYTALKKMVARAMLNRLQACDYAEMKRWDLKLAHLLPYHQHTRKSRRVHQKRPPSG